MTRDELAAKLTGREYRNEMDESEEILARKAGLLVVFGASDDLVEFRGAFRDETGAWEGRDVLITRKGILESHEECDCKWCGYKALAKTASKIKAEWCPNDTHSWVMSTKLPHSTFEILDEGEAYCQGLILNVRDIPE